MRTTLELPDSLHRMARLAAMERGISLRTLMAGALKREIRADRPDKRTRRVNRPFIKVSSNAPVLTMTPQQLKEADSAAETEHFLAVARGR